MATTPSHFNASTSAFEAAELFAEEIRGKTILVTGPSLGGIGGVTVLSLASQRPALLILAARSAGKVKAVVEDINSKYPGTKTRTLELDLAVQSSCRRAAAEILNDTSIPEIDILINNAAVCALPERTLNENGIEFQFATNHIGHFLFTNSIMPKLLTAANSKYQHRLGQVRIINVSSHALTISLFRFSDWNFNKRIDDLPRSEQPIESGVQGMKLFGYEIDPSQPYHEFIAYAQSKTANALFSVALNQRLFQHRGILTVSVHPGSILTALSRYSTAGYTPEYVEKAKAAGIVFKTLDAGASTTIRAALDPGLSPSISVDTDPNLSNLFLSDCQIADWVPRYARDPGYAEQLWKISEDLVGESFRF